MSLTGPQMSVIQKDLFYLRTHGSDTDRTAVMPQPSIKHLLAHPYCLNKHMLTKSQLILGAHILISCPRKTAQVLKGTLMISMCFAGGLQLDT